ncbi:Uncharacterised protein [Streptococcus suis]|uniref:Uncharacterized protein n=1 Tax=Streptococcus suis TaxID=1307 RepID=A0A822VN64_STRSU|nr:hypothetical protein T15_0234 [Streptococcus suis T15]CYU11669.1 Uncharacterised protein [Streptococcus suis]CYU19486.1 Uncharacterised protein [Streptococcus suis]CYU27481.1 Uncharacterised protein [Streptococcus suis]CYU79920.1 Uncharacterised protein [Streptococcus suis]
MQIELKFIKSSQQRLILIFEEYELTFRQGTEVQVARTA